MKFSEPIKIKAEVITPIHIGSGEEIKPISYVTDKEFVYVVDYDKFVSSLTEKEQEAYQKWIEEITSELAAIKKKLEQAEPNLKKELKKKIEDDPPLEPDVIKKIFNGKIIKEG